MSASLVGSEMCIRDRLSASDIDPACAAERNRSPGCCRQRWERAPEISGCLLYTSDAADDM
eukprot:15296139-Alexandrium_andersonii.AAC.1